MHDWYPINSKKINVLSYLDVSLQKHTRIFLR